ncbi:MAG: hypothetical protein U0T83_02610 [Bacteriovoracaceae bacterium]
MKKLILGFVFALNLAVLTNGDAFAYFWQERAFVQGNAYQATATLWNRYPRPIVCSGNLTGYTWGGYTAYSFMNSNIIYPGQSRYLVVFTNY